MHMCSMNSQQLLFNAAAAAAAAAAIIAVVSTQLHIIHNYYNQIKIP